MNVCRIEVCDRPVLNKKRQLCTGHYTRWKKGKDLNTPLGKPGGTNKKYTEDSKCEFEGCDNRPVARNKCQTHNWQMKTHGEMWPIGNKPKEERNVYSETKKCPVCKETKHWRSFVMGMANPTDECRACYRARLSDLAISEEPKKKVDLLEWLDACNKSA